MTTFEKELWSRNIQFVAGVDEAGRGPLAGPVVAAAVILKKDSFMEGVRDSKKLSPNRREELFPAIVNESLSYGIGVIEHHVIDDLNIRSATFAAMRCAISKLSMPPDHVLVDGYPIPGLDLPQSAIIGGDDISLSIAAASILAKVYRDRMMELYDAAYPQYGFARNKGYATPQHVEALLSHGPCKIHRKTFRPVRDLIRPQ
ncbi:ribonuclease HII [candidate division TA06 bacterium]|uniref:Ribonuclease HII n=2 Tax=candidate division TA06 bacterium TaxID=2250710 RepID=A0A523US56_UNCT6|nr:MAG: ribonuclease HII [candidate division TA06 bacterium]